MKIKISSHRSPVERFIEAVVTRQSHILFSSPLETMKAQLWINSPEAKILLKDVDVFRKSDRAYQFIMSLFSITKFTIYAQEIRIDYGVFSYTPSIIINGSSAKGLKVFERAVYYMNPCVGILDFDCTQKNYYNQLIDWRINNKFHGDYFRHNCEYKCTKKTHTINGLSLTLSCLEFDFRTSLKNEQLFRREVCAISASTASKCSSDYEKVKAIYRYIVGHVTYDYSFSYYSAYHALIKGTAVCEGVSLLLHSMLRQVNIPTRIISGFGKNDSHSWNIVKLDGSWYNLDATWDLGKSDFFWQFFLRGSTNFPNHTTDSKLAEELREDSILVSVQDYERRCMRL